MRKQKHIRLSKRFSSNIRILGGIYMNLGDFIKCVRMRHNLTQSEMGDICMRSKDWIYLVENGKLNPSNEDLVILGNKLDEPLLLFISYGIMINSLFALKK